MIEQMTPPRRQSRAGVPASTAILAGLTILAAACTSSATSSPTPVACLPPNIAAVDGSLTLTAGYNSFDTNCLDLAAGVATTVSFHNASTESHNFLVYTDASKSEQIFVGQIISGGATIDYNLPALDAGTYYFECSLHSSTMHGPVVVH